MKCRIEGCERPVHVKKWNVCKAHYDAARRQGLVPRRPGAPPVCVEDSCERTDVVAHGLCDLHYGRFKRKGHTGGRLTIRERFDKYSPDRPSDGCWEWAGHRNDKGYALLRQGSDAHVYAHRLSYELHVGPIPDGLQVDHLCRNRACVNPSHLEPVTQHVNILRSENMAAKWARRTACDVCGGAFSERKGRRFCPKCERERNARNKAKRSA